MKKLVVFLLTVFTMGTAVVCGCNTAKTRDYDDKIDTESVQIEVTEDEQTEPECPHEEKQDGECPEPRKPHKKHGKKLPRPESAYRKH